MAMEDGENNEDGFVVADDDAFMAAPAGIDGGGNIPSLPTQDNDEDTGTLDLPVADEQMDVDTEPENLPANDDEHMEDTDKEADAAAEAVADSVGHQDFSTFNESAENFSGEP